MGDSRRRSRRPLIPGLGGVDEAGRGPLAGPVVAAVVVFEPGQEIAGVRDSKRVTPTGRERLAEVIKHSARAWSIAECSAGEIDELNILQATMLAMRRAVEQLDCDPERLVVDGNQLPPLPHFRGNVEWMIQGDALCAPVSAASILAKVHRDEVMLALDAEYPAYGFARHKGYPTAGHREALDRLGPCAAHRRSYRPVRLAAAARGGAV